MILKVAPVYGSIKNTPTLRMKVYPEIAVPIYFRFPPPPSFLRPIDDICAPGSDQSESGIDYDLRWVGGMGILRSRRISLQEYFVSGPVRS